MTYLIQLTTITILILNTFFSALVVNVDPSKTARWHSFTAANGLAGNVVQAIWEDAEDKLWFGTENGVSRYDGQTWETYRTPQGLVDNNVWSISGDNKAIWFATPNGISRLTAGVWQTYTTADGLPNNDVRAVLVDQTGTVWAGTFGNGIARKTPQSDRWEAIELPSQLSSTNSSTFIQSIWQGFDGELWFGTNGIGALQLRNDKFEWFRFRDPNRNTVWAINGSTDGSSVWLATFQGIIQIDGTDTEIIRTVVDGVVISDTEVLAVASGEPDSVWFGTRSQGVLHKNGNSWERFTIDNGLTRNYVQVVFVDSLGRQWFGTRGGGVTLRDPHPLPSNLRLSIDVEDIGSQKSINQPVLQAQQNTLRFILNMEANWIPSHDISFRYWLSRPDGVTVQSQRLTQNTTAVSSTVATDVFVNLVPGEYTLHVEPIITSNTAQLFQIQEHTYSFSIRSAAPIFTANSLTVQAEGQAVTSGSSLSPIFLGDTRNIQISFSATDDATTPDNLSYEYQLQQHPLTWLQADSGTIVTDLLPGEHKIIIRALDDEGNISEPIALTVIVPPPLWRTFAWYMIIGLMLIIPSGVGGALIYDRWSRHQALRRAVIGQFNPYEVGPLIAVPERYIGREAVLNIILGKIDNHGFYVYGEKRIGKTSLLAQLEQRLHQRNNLTDTDHVYFPVFRNIQDVSQQQFWPYLIRRIASEIPGTPKDLEVYSCVDSEYDEPAAERDFELIIEHAQSLASPRKPLIVLLLDEVDTIERYDRKIRQRFRGFCLQPDMHRHLRCVLVGVMPPRAQSGETSPWHNIFELLTMEPISQEATHNLIRNYNQNPYTYTPDAEQMIVNASDGKPFYTQWICSESVKEMLASGRTHVIVEDADHAIQVVVRARSQDYTSLWEQIPETIRHEIQQAVTGDGYLPLRSQVDPSYDLLFAEGIVLRTTQGSRLSFLFQKWYRSVYA